MSTKYNEFAFFAREAARDSATLIGHIAGRAREIAESARNLHLGRHTR